MRISETIRVETERCWLTCVSEEEIDAVFGALHFPGFTDGLLLEPPENRDVIKEWVKADVTAWRQGKRYVFTIWMKEPRKFAGRIGIRQFQSSGKWNMGFWIPPDLWGKGLAAEAANTVIDIGFLQLACERIWMAHAEWNEQSKRVIRKLPVKFLERDSFEKNGERIENVRYQITVAEWNERKFEQ